MREINYTTCYYVSSNLSTFIENIEFCKTYHTETKNKNTGLNICNKGARCGAMRKAKRFVWTC